MNITKTTTSTGMEIEQAQVEIALGGVTKLVTIERYSEGHCWFMANEKVVVRFRTGTKEHIAGRATVSNKTGSWKIFVQGFRNRNSCFPVRWADNDEQGSGWNK
jgi:hypothetical protein